MTWFGHVHSYSRTCPVFQRNCMGYAPDGTANAPVHMLIGHAGTCKFHSYPVVTAISIPYDSPCWLTCFICFGYNGPADLDHEMHQHYMQHESCLIKVSRNM